MKTLIRVLSSVVLIVLLYGVTMPADAASETADRFVTKGKTVTDSKTGLMWAAEDNGADINLDNATIYCSGFKGGGYDDWRLPTQDELASLYDQQGAGDNGGYSIVSSIKITGCCVWASDKRDARVASFDFDYGNPDWGHQNSTINARALPVRNSKK